MKSFWNPKGLVQMAQMPKLKPWTGNLWKLVQCVTLLTSCKDARLLKTDAKFTGICHRIFGGGEGTNKIKTLTKNDFKKNRTYTVHTEK